MSDMKDKEDRWMLNDAYVRAVRTQGGVLSDVYA